MLSRDTAAISLDKWRGDFAYRVKAGAANVLIAPVVTENLFRGRREIGCGRGEDPKRKGGR
jgi:hypothetical protein